MFSGEAELFLTRPLVCAVDGTHSAGKTTIVEGLNEEGKVHELLDENLLYDDIGYGMVDLPGVNKHTPSIYVPEAARWAADYSGDPELLGEKWNLAFQLQLTDKYKLRIQAAAGLAAPVMRQLIANRPELSAEDLTRPLILADRSGLDGLAYTRLRSNLSNTEVIGGFPTEKFAREWVAHYVDLVLLSDYDEIPFELDPARSSDQELRKSIAREIAADYYATLPPERIQTLHGDPEQRQNELLQFIAQHI
ncbi:MAG TPA: hypothetical protein VHB72_02805 [Candidatus Saccharimonadales bacterium]|nr:hypothetical protein [Candidatus Saccharimonadales bacterium]